MLQNGLFWHFHSLNNKNEAWWDVKDEILKNWQFLKWYPKFDLLYPKNDMTHLEVFYTIFTCKFRFWTIFDRAPRPNGIRTRLEYAPIWLDHSSLVIIKKLCIWDYRDICQLRSENFEIYSIYSRIYNIYVPSDAKLQEFFLLISVRKTTSWRR